MAELHDIDGLLILGATLVAVTAFSALRGLYARSRAHRRPPQHVVAISIQGRKSHTAMNPTHVHRKAA